MNPPASPAGLTLGERWLRRVEIETGLREVTWEERQCDYGSVLEITVSGRKADGTRVEVFAYFWVRLSDRRSASEIILSTMRDRLLARVSARPSITRAFLDGMRADDPDGYRRFIAANPDVGRWHRRPADNAPRLDAESVRMNQVLEAMTPYSDTIILDQTRNAIRLAGRPSERDVGERSSSPPLPPSDTGLEGAIPLPDVEPRNYTLLAGGDEVSDDAWAAQNRRANDVLYRSEG